LAETTGIRPGESFKLKIKDFHFKQFLVTVPQEIAKTRVERNLPILAPTAEIIKKLINVRCDSWGDSIPIFCTNEGRQMTKGVWDERMQSYSKKLGFKIRPYNLRHSFTLLYLRNGGHAFGLQKTLGHTDMQMTKRYINLTGQDLKEQHNIASPITGVWGCNPQEIKNIHPKLTVTFFRCIMLYFCFAKKGTALIFSTNGS